MMESPRGVASPQTPLVSIVTPTFNMAAFLTEAIESVLSQDYPRIELIVVDGGSTDGTISILSSYGDRLSFTSGPDRGPADAIAIGLRRASGDIVAWLNADDTLLPGAVRHAAEHLRQHPEVDVVYGEGWWVDERGARIARYPSLPFDERRLRRDCIICQPTAFIRASAYRRCEVDPDVTCAFDYDLWIRLAKAGHRFSFTPREMATSRLHAGGLTLREREKVFQSSMSVLSRHYGYIPLQWVFGYTCFRIDGRDQFFEPLRPTAFKYLAALHMGLRRNRGARFRFLAEWASKPFHVALSRLFARSRQQT